jgi:hypothetical protein
MRKIFRNKELAIAFEDSGLQRVKQPGCQRANLC